MTLDLIDETCLQSSSSAYSRPFETCLNCVAIYYGTSCISITPMKNKTAKYSPPYVYESYLCVNVHFTCFFVYPTKTMCANVRVLVWLGTSADMVITKRWRQLFDASTYETMRQQAEETSHFEENKLAGLLFIGIQTKFIWYMYIIRACIRCLCMQIIYKLCHKTGYRNIVWKVACFFFRYKGHISLTCSFH